MATSNELELIQLIKNNIININTQESFFSKLIKGLLYDLSTNIKIRESNIPHIILSTGDDIMYLEVKGQNQSIEPYDISNENYVYSMIPRGIVTPSGVNIDSEQLTSPYSRGTFQIEYKDNIYEMTAEFRRMSVTMNVGIKYYFDTFSDTLMLIQYILTNLSYIRTFDIQYMGQQIACSYRLPDGLEEQFNAQFDGLSLESKYKTVNIELEVESNLPVFYQRTVVPANCTIIYPQNNIGFDINIQKKHLIK